MARKYRLVSAVNVPQRYLIDHRMYRLNPGVTYEEEKDSAMEELLKIKIRLRASEATKAALDASGVEYEEKVCKQCGGRIIKYEFNAVEEVN